MPVKLQRQIMCKCCFRICNDDTFRSLNDFYPKMEGYIISGVFMCMRTCGPAYLRACKSACVHAWVRALQDCYCSCCCFYGCRRRCYMGLLCFIEITKCQTERLQMSSRRAITCYNCITLLENTIASCDKQSQQREIKEMCVNQAVVVICAIHFDVVVVNGVRMAYQFSIIHNTTLCGNVIV